MRPHHPDHGRGCASLATKPEGLTVLSGPGSAADLLTRKLAELRDEANR